jgi:V/A-type H+-transporting ATPase subunit I
MIEKMKQITVICLTADREQTVERLRELGLVHVTDVQPPQSDELGHLAREHERCARALGMLRSRTPETAPAFPSDLPSEGAAIVNEALNLDARIEHAYESRAGWVRNRHLLEPWGSFSHDDLHAMRSTGLQVVLGSALESRLPELPDSAVLHPISRQGKTVYFAVVAPAGLRLSGFSELPFPDESSLAHIDQRIAECDRVMADAEKRLDSLTAGLEILESYDRELSDRLALLRARDGMGASARLRYLQGYVPAARVDALREAAVNAGWGLRVLDPADDDPAVPTKISLPAWVEPIRTVFHALGITPGYREVDISACFLLFFSVFFAILIGDAGYGVLFLIATFVLRKRFPNAPAPPFRLFTVLSITTIIWGVLSGTYFGIVLPDGSVLRQLPSVAYLEKPENVQWICFLLGAVHLTVAHLWNAVVIGRSLKALSQLAWIAILWGNYFLALKFVLGREPHPAMLPLYVGGVAGVILFTAPQRNPLKMVGMGLGDLAMSLINSFVDVVSYVRLFAVGTASVKVAQSFNEMAGGFDGLPFWLGGLVAALILVFGHALNITLGAMGVLVHGVRLNVLEFAGHVGLQFSGTPYDPLRKQAGN